MLPLVTVAAWSDCNFSGWTGTCREKNDSPYVGETDSPYVGEAESPSVAEAASCPSPVATRTPPACALIACHVSVVELDQKTHRQD